MTDARDELVDVIAEAPKAHGLTEGFTGTDSAFYRNYLCTCGWWSTADQEADFERHQAQAVLAALVSRYGEPEIEDHAHVRPLGPGSITTWVRRNERRLVFPWQAVKEAASDV